MTGGSCATARIRWTYSFSHKSNGPSGGTPSRVALAAFLASGKVSSENRALLVMMGSLVEAAPAASTPPFHSPEPGAVGAELTLGEASVSI